MHWGRLDTTKGFEFQNNLQTAGVGAAPMSLPPPATQLDPWQHTLQGDRYCSGNFSEERKKNWVILDPFLE